MLINREVLDIISRPIFISHSDVYNLLEYPSLNKEDQDGISYDTDNLSGYSDFKHKTFYLITSGLKPIVKYCPLAVKYQKEYYDITLC